MVRLDMHVQKLQQLGFKIPKTIFISLFENTFPLQIFEYEHGRHITDNELPQAGKLMGKIHLVDPGCIKRFFARWWNSSNTVFSKRTDSL